MRGTTSPDIARIRRQGSYKFDIIQSVKSHIEGSLAVTKCCPNPIRFSSVRRRKVEAEFSFSGSAINGNGSISLPDVGILVAASNRKTDLSCTTHAISGLAYPCPTAKNSCRQRPSAQQDAPRVPSSASTLSLVRHFIFTYYSILLAVRYLVVQPLRNKSNDYFTTSRIASHGSALRQLALRTECPSCSHVWSAL